jgi:excisionase family DNA binding protein
VSRQLGHTNAVTLKVYAHAFDGGSHAARAQERLEEDYGALLATRVPLGALEQPGASRCPSPCRAGISCDVATARPALRLDLDLDRLVDEVATRVAAQLADRIASQAPSPWMAMEEAIAYTRIPAGTFRKWVAAGRIPAHGGRRKLFHRDELDAALGYERTGVGPLAGRYAGGSR